MNETQIEALLFSNGYTEKQAKTIANELLQIDTSLQPLLEKWMEKGTETDVEAEGFSLVELMKQFKMTYPAALLTIDWLIKEPEIAVKAVRKGIK
ncbi:MAG: hypothetical protein IKH26_05825 [Bacteroidaceae bacterium]|nr:hypothetical protein [Bacteroidaceae bacterium]